MAEAYKPGDIVQLKSGGPGMTVTRVLDRIVHTSWFAGKKNETAAFPVGAVFPFKVDNNKK